MQRAELTMRRWQPRGDRSARSLPPLLETEKADLAETEKSLALMEVSQAARQSSCARGASVHKTYVEFESVGKCNAGPPE